VSIKNKYGILPIMRIQRFEDVIAWQKAKILTIDVHGSFKNCRNLTYKDQIFRASLSIMNNIAEGFDRGTDKELCYFLTNARGSTAEVRSMLLVSVDFGYLTKEKQQYMLDLTNEISRLLSGFINKLKHTKTERLMTVD
jgi:four helix bundle protein